MAKINLGAVLKEFYNEVDLSSQATNKDGSVQSLTLREVCIEALLSTYNDEPNLSGQEKYARYKLARALDKKSDDPLTQISSEDVALLKSLIAKKYVPLVIGQAFDFLEQE